MILLASRNGAHNTASHEKETAASSRGIANCKQIRIGARTTRKHSNNREHDGATDYSVFAHLKTKCPIPSSASLSGFTKTRERSLQSGSQMSAPLIKEANVLLTSFSARANGCRSAANTLRERAAAIEKDINKMPPKQLVSKHAIDRYGEKSDADLCSLIWMEVRWFKRTAIGKDKEAQKFEFQCAVLTSLIDAIPA